MDENLVSSTDAASPRDPVASSPTARIFDAAEHRGKGIQFSDVPVPSPLADAFSTARKIPPEGYDGFLPPPDISVERFVGYRLPAPSRSFSFLPPARFFSREHPVTPFNMSIVPVRQMPPLDVLKSIGKRAGQAWLDGQNSVMYAHLKETLPCPIWLISVWETVVELRDMQRNFSNAFTWLANFGGPDPNLAQSVQHIRSRLASAPWFAVLPGFKRCSPCVSDLWRLAGKGWLNDELVNAVLEIAHSKCGSETSVLPLGFLSSLGGMHSSMLAGKEDSRKWVAQVGRDLCSGKLTRIGMIASVSTVSARWTPESGGDHWVALVVDMDDKCIHFYDSLSGTCPSALSQTLRWWMGTAGLPRLPVRQASGTEQTDAHNCGLFAIDWMLHALRLRSGPLLGPSSPECSLARLHLLGVLLNSLSAAPDAQAVPPAAASVPTAPRQETDATSPAVAASSAVQGAMHSSSSSSRFAADSAASGLDTDGPEPLPAIARAGSNPLDARSAEESDGNALMSDAVSVPDTIESELEPSSTRSAAAPALKRHVRHRMAPSPPVSPKKKRARTSKAGVDRRDADFRGTVGVSGAAVRSRDARAAVKDGSFVVETKKLERMEKAILMDLDHVAIIGEFANVVTHSTCGTPVVLQAPYWLANFRTHVENCNVTRAPTPPPSTIPALRQTVLAFPPRVSGPPPRHGSCPALDVTFDTRVKAILDRIGQDGGGAPAEYVVARGMFGDDTDFKLLSEAQKNAVRVEQRLKWTWTRDLSLRIVRATACTGEGLPAFGGLLKPCRECQALLTSKSFNTTARAATAEVANAKYIRKTVLPTGQAAHMDIVRGVGELLDPSSAASPYLRFAQGVVDGKFANKDVLLGLVRTAVAQADKEKRGVGMQGMRWDAKLAQFYHKIAITSPRVYKLLKAELGGPAERTFEIHRAKEGRLPLEVIDLNFERLQQYCDAHAYSDLLALSCDETKLKPDWGTYYDTFRQSWCLVGGDAGPIPFSNIDELRGAFDSAQHTKATKIRVWCVSIPLPDTEPHIFAAVPVGSKNTIPDYLRMHNAVLPELVRRGFKIASYSTDGAETERGMQRAAANGAPRFLKFTVAHPLFGQPPLEYSIPIHGDTPVAHCMDAEHGRKGLRNFLFSGARAPTLGNHLVTYSMFAELVMEPGTPLHLRDVFNTDRQSDHAASRLFSAETLEFIIDRHPDWNGAIIFLFTFGELVDSWVSRTMSNHERAKICFRTKFFMQAWDTFLRIAEYPPAHGFARETREILTILSDKMIELLIIYRDYSKDGNLPFAPWLHATVVNEHVFGMSRQLIPDFTALDFLYMLDKLRVLLSRHFNEPDNAKARASGYHHTYFKSDGLNLSTASCFPSSEELDELARIGFEECQSLLSHLGIDPSALFPSAPAHVGGLPGISSFPGELPPQRGSDTLASDSDDEFEMLDWFKEKERDDNTEISVNELVDKFIEDFNDAPLMTSAADNRMEALVLATMSEQMDRLVQIDDIEESASAQEHCGAAPIGNTGSIAPSGAVASDEPEAPRSAAPLYDLSVLVALRRAHQPSFVSAGVRTSSKAPKVDEGGSIKRRFLDEMNATVKKERERVEAGTPSMQGLMRKHRWFADLSSAGGYAAVMQPATGNSANAVAALKAAVAKRAAARRRVFGSMDTMPSALRTTLSTAGVGALKPIKKGDFVLFVQHKSLYLGLVQALFTKLLGKGAMHCDSASVDDINGISYMLVRSFEPSAASGPFFRGIYGARAPLGVNTIAQLHPHQIILRVEGEVEIRGNNARLLSTALGWVNAARKDAVLIIAGLEKLNPRKKSTAFNEEE